MDWLQRREFITLISGAVAAWPLGTRASAQEIAAARLAGRQTMDEWGFNKDSNLQAHSAA
jgi:hypothetical protein